MENVLSEDFRHDPMYEFEINEKNEKIKELKKEIEELKSKK